MTDDCTIGPIGVTYAQLFDDMEFSKDGNSFTLITTPDKAKQIMGLARETDKLSTDRVQIISGGSPWGVIWVDSSVNLDSNYYFINKGWYVLDTVELKTGEIDRIDVVKVLLTGTRISTDPNEFLTMDYSTGYNDGTNINEGYQLVSAGYGAYTTTYQINDDFADFDTTIWNTIRSYNTTGRDDGIDTERLYLTLGKGSGDTAGGGIFQSKKLYKPPFTLEAKLEYGSLPPSGKNYFGIGLSTLNYPTASSTIKNRDNWLQAEWDLGASSAIIKCNGKQLKGSWVLLDSGTSTGATKTAKVKFIFDAVGNVKIYHDIGVTGTYTEMYSGPCNISGWQNGVYIIPYFLSTVATTRTVYWDDIQVYSEISEYYEGEEVEIPNIVSLPATCTPLTTQDFVRASEDGNIPCYNTPNTELRFKITPANLYKGSVQAYNSNYPDSTARLITHTDEISAVDEFTMKNGIIQITVTDPNYVNLSIWGGDQYYGVDNFTIDSAISLIKPLYVSPDKVSIQINSTKWTMFRGKPFLYVEHPYTDILKPSALIKDRAYYDDTTKEDPPSGWEITMQDQNYALLYDDGGVYGSMVLKSLPDNIEVDTIPASRLTGIGAYTQGETAGDPDHPAELAKEFLKQTHTQINLKRII